MAMAMGREVVWMWSAQSLGSVQPVIIKLIAVLWLENWPCTGKIFQKYAHNEVAGVLQIRLSSYKQNNTIAKTYYCFETERKIFLNICLILLIFRLCFIVTLFFLLFSLLMINVKSSKDPRAGMQNGFWAIKFLLIIGGWIGAFFIPHGAFGMSCFNIFVTNLCKKTCIGTPSPYPNLVLFPL